MTSFNNTNLFHSNYNLVSKNNLIKVTNSSWKQYLFDYNLIEKTFVKNNLIVLKSFFNQKTGHHYFLLYKAKSHKIFKKVKKKKRNLKLKQTFLNTNIFPLPKLFSFLKPFLMLGHSFLKIYIYYLINKFFTTRLSIFSFKDKSKSLYFFLLIKFFLNWTRLKVVYLNKLFLFKKKWILFKFKFNLYMFSYGILFNQFLFLKIKNLFFVVNLLTLSKLFIYYYHYFLSLKLRYLGYFLGKINNCFWLLLKQLCNKLKEKSLSVFFAGFTHRKLTGNQFWKFKLQNKLYKFIQRPLNFTIFFWNKLDKSLLVTSYGGYTLSKNFIFFLKRAYKNLDFIKQRKFFFFKDTLNLLFLSVFFLNVRIFSKHLSRLFMLMRKHKDLFQVLKWILTSPLVLRWLRHRLFALRIVVKGRIGKSERSREKNFGFRQIPMQTYKYYILYSLSSARTWYGSYGIKIWFWYNEKTINSIKKNT